MGTPLVLDLFAGAGGWSLALADLGFDPVGVEWDRWACATRRAAGLDTLRADVASLDPGGFAGTVGLVASPPCQPFSLAGSRRGFDDPRAHLVHQPARFARALRPAWVAFEEVPAVLPVWEHAAARLRALGYATWTGVLRAEQYGLPQTRRRAFLLASRLARHVTPPPPTRHPYRHGGPRHPGPPLAAWASMADALGRGLVDRPSWTVTTNGDLWGGPNPRRAYLEARRSPDRWAGPRHRLTVPELGVLQGFPPGHPWQGGTVARLRQIGNAVPPPLAAAVLSRVVARPAAQLAPGTPGRSSPRRTTTTTPAPRACLPAPAREGDPR